jgi:hypothetical protein
MYPGDIARRFDHHVPDTARAEAHRLTRERIKKLALDLQDRLPEGREKSLAMTKLEEAMFWANAAIARQEAP